MLSLHFLCALIDLTGLAEEKMPLALRAPIGYDAGVLYARVSNLTPF